MKRSLGHKRMLAKFFDDVERVSKFAKTARLPMELTPKSNTLQRIAISCSLRMREFMTLLRGGVLWAQEAFEYNRKMAA